MNVHLKLIVLISSIYNQFSLILNKTAQIFKKYNQKNISKIRITQNNNRRMSVTISNCNQICNSPTNTSMAKMLYTFSKDSRFHQRRLILCDKFYDVKAGVTSRAASFGFGHKYDFTKNAPHSPPPTSYEAKSDFDKNQKKGFGFGFGRTEMEVTGPLAETKRNKNPGPGNYNLKHSISSPIAFSLRGKNPKQLQNKEKQRVPGPGTYPTSFNINQKGNYFLSKFKNSCTRNFNSSVSRNRQPINKIPGPGAYNTKGVQFSPEGKYFWSKYQSSSVRKFGQSPRSQINLKSETPGPGQYKLPSEFGHYIAKNALEKPQTEQIGRRYEDKENSKLAHQV